MTTPLRVASNRAGLCAQWLGLYALDSATQDTSVYPAFTEDLRASMREDTLRFVDHVLWEDDANKKLTVYRWYSEQQRVGNPAYCDGLLPHVT